MSIKYCEDCQQEIDEDFDVEHEEECNGNISPEYPLGGVVEPYDMERDKELTN